MSMIIGLIGFKQVGKSTAAKYLEEKHDFVRHNMKDALVAEIKQNFPDLLELMCEDYFEATDVDWLFENKPPLMRALLQNYGTEVRRRDNDNYWVWKWNEKYLQSNAEHFVTDDVRFLNEAKTVREADGILIRLTRPDITTGGSHASEIEQLEIEADYTIECQPGDHEHLYKELDSILSSLRST